MGSRIVAGVFAVGLLGAGALCIGGGVWLLDRQGEADAQQDFMAAEQQANRMEGDLRKAQEPYRAFLVAHGEGPLAQEAEQRIAALAAMAVERDGWEQARQAAQAAGDDWRTAIAAWRAFLEAHPQAPQATEAEAAIRELERLGPQRDEQAELQALEALATELIALQDADQERARIDQVAAGLHSDSAIRQLGILRADVAVRQRARQWAAQRETLAQQPLDRAAEGYRAFIDAHRGTDEAQAAAKAWADRAWQAAMPAGTATLSDWRQRLADLQAFVQAHPNSVHVAAARTAIEQLRRQGSELERTHDRELVAPLSAAVASTDATGIAGLRSRVADIQTQLLTEEGAALLNAARHALTDRERALAWSALAAELTDAGHQTAIDACQAFIEAHPGTPEAAQARAAAIRCEAAMEDAQWQRATEQARAAVDDPTPGLAALATFLDRWPEGRHRAEAEALQRQLQRRDIHGAAQRVLADLPQLANSSAADSLAEAVTAVEEGSHAEARRWLQAARAEGLSDDADAALAVLVRRTWFDQAAGLAAVGRWAEARTLLMEARQEFADDPRLGELYEEAVREDITSTTRDHWQRALAAMADEDWHTAERSLDYVIRNGNAHYRGLAEPRRDTCREERYQAHYAAAKQALAADDLMTARTQARAGLALKPGVQFLQAILDRD